MIKLLLSFVISAVLLNTSCSEDLLVRKPRKNPMDSQKPLSEEELGKELDKALAQKFSDYETFLSKAIINAMNYNVPRQNTPWSCGLVSSNLVLVAAYLKALGTVDKQSVANCNEKGSYPLIIDQEVTDEVNKEFPFIGFIAPLEELKGKKYLRVGALPQGIEQYLNSKLVGTNLTAKLYSEDKSSFTKETLFQKIRENIAQDMPTLILKWEGDAPEELRLHYVVALGYSKDKKSILYMDTGSPGPDRLKTVAADFLFERMNLSKVRERLATFRTNKIKDLGLDFPVSPNIANKTAFEAIEDFGKKNPDFSPPPSAAEIASMKDFNLITF